MLYRVREFVNTKVLKLIYHAIFGLSFTLCKYSSKQRFTKFPIITYYNRKKPSELLVFNVEMFIQTLFYIGIKLLNYQTKSLLKIAFLLVNLLVLIFHQFSIIGLPFPQTLIGQKHPVLQKHS